MKIAMGRPKGKEKRDTVALIFYVPAETAKKAKRVARRRKISLSEYCRELLSNSLRREP